MFLNPIYSDFSSNNGRDNAGIGYFAGLAQGVLTAGGERASREIRLFKIHFSNTANHQSFEQIAITKSNEDGHYLFWGIDETAKYLIMARDNKGDYEPFCYDTISPATDLTIKEQIQLFYELKINK